MFGMLYGLAQEVTTIYKLLELNQHKCSYGTVFENDMCKAICNGIYKGCEQFFSQHKSNYDIQNNRFATVDLLATRMTLLLNMSNNNINKRQQEQDPTRRTHIKQESKPSFTTDIRKYWKELSDKYKAVKVIVPKKISYAIH